MSDIAVSVENLGKCYQIGQAKSGDFRQSFGSWMDKLRGRNNGQAAESKEFWALKDINFEIKKGEAVGIIGRNGAGKSTLLKILSRITEPTKGRFEINGRVSSLLEVGTGFHPELSGRENIYLNGTILGMKRREIKAKLDEIVAFSGVEKFIDTPVKHYSSGMKVRLAFSVAAHLEPEILIVDEVLAVGDAEFQKKCLGKMDEVSRNEGRTVLFVSHNMGAVERLCSKAVLLKDGLMFKLGNTQVIIKDYLSLSSEASTDFVNQTTGNQLKPLWFKRIYLANDLGERSYEFMHDEDIWIHYEIGYNIDFNGHDYNLFCMVLDQMKNRIFAAESEIIRTNHIRLKISKEFLVRGSYSLHTFIHKPKTEQVDRAEDVCQFTIVDNGSYLNIHGEYDYGKVFGKARWFY
jgi:lipopolysaccharide transport system ATP-binding protein